MEWSLCSSRKNNTARRWTAFEVGDIAVKPIVLSVTIPASTFICQLNPSEEIADGPSPDLPELQVLNAYAGLWEDEIEGRPEKKRRESGEWVLDGRYMRQSWSTEATETAPKASGLTLMTYDPNTKLFRSWAFLATGSVIENEGVWNAANRTMTWGHRLPETGETVVTKTSFPEETVQAWSMMKTDARDVIIREISGRRYRRSLIVS